MSTVHKGVSGDGLSENSTNPVNDPTLLKIPDDIGYQTGQEKEGLEANSNSNSDKVSNHIAEADMAIGMGSAGKGKGRVAGNEKEEGSEEEGSVGSGDEEDEDLDLQLWPRQVHTETKLFLQQLPERKREGKISWLKSCSAYEFERENNILRNKVLLQQLFEGKSVAELLFTTPSTSSEHSAGVATFTTPPEPAYTSPTSQAQSESGLLLPTTSEHFPTSPTPQTSSEPNPAVPTQLEHSPTASRTPETPSEAFPSEVTPVAESPVNPAPDRENALRSLDLAPMALVSLTPDLSMSAKDDVGMENEEDLVVDMAGWPRWLSEAYSSLVGVGKPLPKLWKSTVNDWVLVERYYGFLNPSGQVRSSNLCCY